MKHLIVGTAGHVDHGKTALIKYLTGTDTDRLIEEKKRGISIDIGFAVLRCGEELTLGIVDVPGHEKFLKNMLAGTGGIDLVLLIIAADEGIMPQTREHFEMLQCLGVAKGIVVITKTDKVDAEWLEMVEEEVQGFIKGSFLDGAPIARVSAVSGDGMDALRQLIMQEAINVNERDKAAPFRLWIDRAFNLKGHGLVTTGSVLSGAVKAGDTVVMQPDGRQVKIREIETHNQNALTVNAGQRASFKITGLSLADVGRGMAISEDGYGEKGHVWDASVSWRNRFPSGTRIRFHIGTAEFIGRMVYSPADAEVSLIRIYLEQHLVAALGDHGLLRRYSPQNLIGGVLLLRPAERGTPRELLASLTQNVKRQDQAGTMLAILSLAKEPLTLKEWKRRAGYVNKESVEKAARELIHGAKVKQAENYYITAEQLTQLQKNLLNELASYHREKPSETGLSREVLRQKLHQPGQFTDWLLQEGVRQKLVVMHEDFVALPTHAAKHGSIKEEILSQMEALVPDNEIVEISPEWIAEKIKRPLSEIKPIFDAMIREKIVIRLTGVHVYRKTIQYIGSVIQQHFKTNPTLSVGELRDLLGTSRRLVIPILEYFDSHKYTVRKEDCRLPGPNLQNLSE